jgi:quinol-cytochrome oxidoreductase complex cytochrome b subunit
MQKEFFLAGTIPGAETLNRVYFLHIMLLPIIITTFMGVHFWRIRKDGGLTRPDNFTTSENTDRGNLLMPEKTGGIFTTNKTYGLMTLSKGNTPAVDKDVENTVLSWPNLAIAEAAVFVLCLAGVIIYSIFVDAPLKEAANALIPENPAKAPWYFLGLQEMVSYSAFMGSIVIPSLSVLGLALIPYLDRDQKDVGIWFSGKQGKTVAIKTLIVGSVCLIGMLAFVINFGWFRNWWPSISQLWIILINPAVIWLLFVCAWSIWIIKSTGSTRMGAIALFTMFLVSYLILTYVGTELRGPNWEFFWSRSQWPIH